MNTSKMNGLELRKFIGEYFTKHNARISIKLESNDKSFYNSTEMTDEQLMGTIFNWKLKDILNLEDNKNYILKPLNIKTNQRGKK